MSVKSFFVVLLLLAQDVQVSSRRTSSILPGDLTDPDSQDSGNVAPVDVTPDDVTPVDVTPVEGNVAPVDVTPVGVKSLPQNYKAHIGLEVEFADGRVNRKFKMKNGSFKAQYKEHSCAPLLEYSVPWFKSAEVTSDLDEAWGSNFPKLEIESEIYYRDTIEIVTGPLKAEGAVKAAGWIAMLSKLLKGKQVPLTSGSSKTKSFQSIAQEASGLTMLPEIDASTEAEKACGEKVYVKAANQALSAGVQVNFEMKLSQVPKITQGTGAFHYFGAGGMKFWQQAQLCLEQYTAVPTLSTELGLAKSGPNSGPVLGALLLTFHQASVIEDCERANHESACKKGRVALLPKTTLDSDSKLAGGKRTLSEVTGKTWEEIKARIQEHKLSQCKVPTLWRPDDHMFSKSPPGLGGDVAEPLVVMEARSGASGIAAHVKAFLTAFESSSNTPADFKAPGQLLKRQFEALQRWAFFSNGQL